MEAANRLVKHRFIGTIHFFTVWFGVGFLQFRFDRGYYFRIKHPKSKRKTFLGDWQLAATGGDRRKRDMWGVWRV